jgi:hypothetical protein
LNCRRYDSRVACPRGQGTQRRIDAKARQFVLLVLPCRCCGSRARRRQGQFEPRAADIRAWFKSVIAPNGVPCCVFRRSHRTTTTFGRRLLGADRRPVDGGCPSARSFAIRATRSARPWWYVSSPRQHHHQLLRAGGRGLDSSQDDAVRRDDNLPKLNGTPVTDSSSARRLATIYPAPRPA